MALQLFTLTPDEILPQKRFRSQDLAIVVDPEAKAIHIYKSQSTPSLSEIQSVEIYERIMNRFLNPNIFLLNTLEIRKEDTDSIRNVKEFLLQTLQRNKAVEFLKKLQILPLFGGLRGNYAKMIQYSQSFVWRSRLSNRSRIWGLIATNFIGITLIALFLSLSLFNSVFPAYSNPLTGQLWLSWVENLGIVLGGCILISAILMVVNITFLLFPLKFPIHPPAQSPQD